MGILCVSCAECQYSVSAYPLPVHICDNAECVCYETVTPRNFACSLGRRTQPSEEGR